MTWWDSNLKFSVGAISKLPLTQAPTEKMKRSKRIQIPGFPFQVTLFSEVFVK